MKLGRRQYGTDERERTAIDSMMLGTIGGDSKIGMPIVETLRMPLEAPPPVIPCLSFTVESVESSTAWSVPLPPGLPGDFIFAYVMTTQNPTSTPAGWTQEQSQTVTFGGTRYRWWRRRRQSGDTHLDVAFSSASTGSVMFVNAEIDPALPGDSWGGDAYNDLSGDFGGVIEPWGFNTNFGPGPYNPDGSILIMQARYTGSRTSGPGGAWNLEVSDTVSTSIHELWSWAGTGTVDDFSWDTNSTTRDLTFIELAHLCTR